MDKERWRAGRCQSGGDLCGDMTTLSHAGHDDAALDFANRFDRLVKAFCQLALESLSERGNASLFGTDGTQGRLNGG